MLTNILLFCFSLYWNPTAELTVNFTTTGASKGTIQAAVYDSPEAFAAEKPSLGQVLTLTESAEDFTVELTDLPEGSCVIAAYHDVNGNGKLDKNLIGAPTEPYGFARMPDSKWSKPEWNDIVEAYAKGTQEVNIILKTWKEW